MTPVVRFLLIANLFAFVLQSVAPVITYLFWFVPALALFRPWTVVTYMFLHGDIMHIGLNMLAVFFFGPRVEDRMGSKRFTILYLLSGLSGAFLHTIFSPQSPIVGASAGVFGVMLAFAHFWPHEPIHIWGIFPVPARALVIFTTVLAVWSGFGGRSDGVAHFAHLGGYAGAYLYLRWIDRARYAFKKLATTAPPTAQNRLERWDTIDLSKVHQVNQQEVGRLLEKIRTQGVGSLSGQERVFLSSFVPQDEFRDQR